MKTELFLWILMQELVIIMAQNFVSVREIGIAYTPMLERYNKLTNRLQLFSGLYDLTGGGDESELNVML